MAKILKDEESRRVEAAKTEYSWHKPKFDAPAAQRRLRLANALLTILERVGRKGNVDRRTLDIDVLIADTNVSIGVTAQGRQPAKSYGPRELELSDLTRERLALEIHGQAPGLPSQWQDTDGRKLEEQLPGIALEVLVSAEMQHRQEALDRRRRIIEHNAYLEAQAKKAQQEAERKERERLAKIEQAKVAHLLKMAERLHKADEIRRLVTAMERADVEGVAFAEWKTWALGVAKGLDPRSSPASLLAAEAPEEEGILHTVQTPSSTLTRSDPFDGAVPGRFPKP